MAYFPDTVSMTVVDFSSGNGAAIDGMLGACAYLRARTNNNNIATTIDSTLREDWCPGYPTLIPPVNASIFF